MPALGSEHIVPEYYRARSFEYFLLMLSAQFLDKLTVLSDTIRSKYPIIVRRKMKALRNPVELSKSIANIGLNKS
jgi:GalNAc-alpha-(1->4)-GalNAc-alpha-(1->3)-diNAcBac-PP-undecaprenol alpha-1,4-N-acetyl-D-galactosaminyltransferase